MSIAELIIGMSLVILLVGLIIPRTDVGYIRAEWERRKICSELRRVKRKNLAGIEEFLYFMKDEKKNCYVIGKRSNIYKKYISPKGIKFRTGMDRIIFAEDGRPYQSGSVTVSYKEKFFEITITPISGRILFKEGMYKDEK